MRLPAPPHLLLGAYCAGLCLALAWRPPLALLGAAVALATGALVMSARAPALGGRAPAALAAGLVALFVCAGVVLGGARLDAIARSTLAPYIGERIALTAVLTDLPSAKEDQVTLAVRVSGVEGREVREPAHLRLRLEAEQSFGHDPTGPLTEGALLRLPSVSVEPLPDPEPGEFDYGRYLRRRGEHVLLEADFGDLAVVGRRGGLQGAVDRLRLASRAHLAAGVHSPVGDVLQGMVLGDDEGVDETLVEDFRRSGLLHIMAVSGENVVLLCTMWSFAFALLGMHRLLRTALLLPVVATYVLLTGASPSIVRAGVAGICGLLAILASRPSDGWLLWLAPAAWLLTVESQQPFRRELPAVVRRGRRPAGARPAAHPRRLVPAGPAPGAGGGDDGGQHLHRPRLDADVRVRLARQRARQRRRRLRARPDHVPRHAVAAAGVRERVAVGAAERRRRALHRLPARGVALLRRPARSGVRVPGRHAAACCWSWACSRRPPWWPCWRRGPAAVCSPTCATAAAGRRSPSRRRRCSRRLCSWRRLPCGRPTGRRSRSSTSARGRPPCCRSPTARPSSWTPVPQPLARTLREHGVGKLDLLVLSHGHDDHVGGLEDIIGACRSRRRCSRNRRSHRPRSTRSRRACPRKGRTCAGASPRKRGRGGLGAEGAAHAAPAASTGTRGRTTTRWSSWWNLRRHRALLPGDAEGQALEDLDLPACVVVEVPHHGSAGG